jgi:cyclophilin family peptidyl-prolyl cis-trans isomerase
MKINVATDQARRVAGIFLLAALAATVGCDAPPPATPAVATATSASAGKARQQFDRTFDEWRSLISRLRGLDVEYRVAGKTEDPAFREEYDRLVTEGRRLEDRLVDAGAIAFVRNPNENKEVGAFLTGVVLLSFEKEEYEEALKTSHVLIDNRVDSPIVYNVAGISAFASGEFTLAQQHFEAAKEHHVLSDVGKKFLEQIDYYKEAWEKEKRIRETEATANDLPRVLLETTQGDIVVELFENEAPNTVANFVHLVEKGFYDGQAFFRVMPQLGAQAGSPKGDGTGGPGYTIRCECYQPDHRLHFRGSLTMAHPDRDKGGSQFLLASAPLQHLDGKHTVFGRIVRGIDVLARLRRRNPDLPKDKATLPDADKILKAKVLRKRNHHYEPQVTPDEPTEEEKLFEEQLDHLINEGRPRDKNAKKATSGFSIFE